MMRIDSFVEMGMVGRRYRAGMIGGVAEGLGLMLAMALLARTADAQTIRGAIYEADSDRAVPGAEVRLLDQGDDEVLRTARTDTLGAFELQTPGPGSFRLGVEVFGFAPTETSDFFIAAGDSLTLEIRVEFSAVPLDPLVVSVFNENRAGFERRKNLSWGTRLGPDVLAERGDLTLNKFTARETPWLSYGGLELYTIPMFGKGRGGKCRPAVWVDGRRIRDFNPLGLDLDRLLARLGFHPSAVEAIEVYPDPSLIPSVFRDDFIRPCSVVAVWTFLGFGGTGVPEAP